MKKTIRFALLLIILPLFLSAQIGSEFNFVKGKNGLTKVRATLYMHVKLDEFGMPVSERESEGEVITLYRGEYAYEVQSFKENDGKKELQSRIVLERNGKDIKKVFVYSYFMGKESLSYTHEAFYVNGKMMLENITTEKGELRGTVQYEEGKTAEGLDFIKMTAKGNHHNMEILKQFDDEGDVFSSETRSKQFKSSQRISVTTQDTVKTIKYLVLNKPNEKTDSIQLMTRTHFDKKGNPTLQVMQFENSKAASEEEKGIIIATYFENFYGDKTTATKPDFPGKDALEGEWQSKSDDLIVFFAPKNEKGLPVFACFPIDRDLVPDLREKDKLVSYEDAWKDDLVAIAPGTFEYDPATGKMTVALHNGKKVDLLAKMEWNTLILTPAKGNMNALRLVKPRH